MWDLPKPRKPFYRRAWFLVPLFLLIVVGIGGAIFLATQKAYWEGKAREFDYSKIEQMESASIIYDRNNAVIGRILIQNRDQVPLEEISANLVTAVIAAEDSRFYEHKGVDY